MRVEFNMKTKKLLAQRAGYLCSHYDCLRPTIAPAKNQKGEDGAVGTGVAAHIYAASELGPRPPVGMTEAQIKALSNGTWMCKQCSTQIDDFRWNYPPERVLEMKRVREFAQVTSATQSDAAYLVGWMGVKRLDLIIRAHLPDLDPEKIRLAILKMGKKFVGDNLVTDGALLLAPSSEFTKSALLEMIKEAEHEIWRGPSIPNIGIEHRWAIEIAREFNKDFYDAGNYDAFNWSDGQVCLRARCPKTGQLSDAIYHAQADIRCKHNPFLREGDEIFLHVASRCGAEWKFGLITKPGDAHVSSQLTLERFTLPTITDGLNQSRQEFEGYAGWIDALVVGFTPVGQIGLRPTDYPRENNLHSGIFHIEMRAQPHRLQAAAELCARVRFAYDLADKFDTSVALNTHLFESGLTLDSLREATKHLMVENPGRDFISDPLFAFPDGVWGLYLRKTRAGLAVVKQRL
ncbi:MULTISPECIES: hypothetical protein [Pseudomonas]|uniref:hypothetical protein n=1 Tax=Pseudomonas TaxID=286 RepID=UPI00081C2786|nr:MULTISPECIES: hypothetical protein [Pseudomonas]RZI19395.1 hypothetical protein EUX53_21470 [Pseudomonas orientalis]